MAKSAQNLPHFSPLKMAKYPFLDPNEFFQYKNDKFWVDTHTRNYGGFSGFNAPWFCLQECLKTHNFSKCRYLLAEQNLLFIHAHFMLFIFHPLNIFTFAIVDMGLKYMEHFIVPHTERKIYPKNLKENREISSIFSFLPFKIFFYSSELRF